MRDKYGTASDRPGLEWNGHPYDACATHTPGGRRERRSVAVLVKTDDSQDAYRRAMKTERLPDVANAATVPDGPIRLRALQRRTLRVLVAAQVFAGLGGSAVTAGSLLAFDVTGSTALASLPPALVVVGASVSVIPISAISLRAGRRAGLTVGLVTASVGAAGIVVAGTLPSFVLLCVASLAFGSGTSAILLARYAAADLSPPGERARAMSRVVFVTTLGGVAGPNLLAPAGAVAHALGLPPLTGLYVFSAVMFVGAAGILVTLLRPDPLLVAVDLQLHTPLGTEVTSARVPLRRLLRGGAARTGLATVITANLVMVAVMTMAPVHMLHQGHDFAFIGLVVGLHVAGMFGPSPLTGWLTDRLGSPPVAALCAVAIMVSGILLAVGGHGGTSFAVGLVLLGLGWNAGLIAGSTLVASAVPASERPRVEAAGDVGMGVAAATATALAGPIAGAAGYAVLALAGAAAAAALGPFLITVLWHPPPEVAPANRLV